MHVVDNGAPACMVCGARSDRGVSPRVDGVGPSLSVQGDRRSAPPDRLGSRLVIGAVDQSLGGRADLAGRPMLRLTTSMTSSV